MPASTSVGRSFLDTCIILSEILNENKSRIEKFKKDVDDHGIPCYISDSVKLECDKKIRNTLDFLGNVIRESVNLALENSRKNRRIPLTSPMDAEDIIVLEKLFPKLFGSARATQLPLLSPIRIVEEWTVTFLGEKLKQGVPITIPQFLTELVKKLLALTSLIQDPYDELVTFEASFAKNISIAVDQSIVHSLREISIHEPDATHIASAVAHQTNSHEDTVFVTIDYASIIAKQADIESAVNIICCDPLYAIYHVTH